MSVTIRHHRLVVGIGCLVVALAFGAYAWSGTSGAQSVRAASSHVNIAVLGCIETPYCVAYETANKTAGAANNATIKYYDAVFSPTKEVSACQDAITAGKYQAMIIASVIPTAGEACVKAAAAAKIPVISTYGPIGTNTAIARPTVPDVKSQVIVPLDTQLKALINRILVPACAKYNPCDLGWLRTTNSLPQADAILDTYLTAALHAHHNIKLIGQVSTDLVEGPAITVTQQFLQKAPDLKVVLSYGAVGLLGADKALTRAGKKPGKDVLIVGSGASETVMKLMRSGAVYGTTVNLPITEMSESIKLAAEVARGKSVPSSVDPITLAHLPLVITQSNLGQYPNFKGQYLQ